MTIFVIYPMVVAVLQPWAEISERLRRNVRKIQTDALQIYSPYLNLSREKAPGWGMNGPVRE